MTDYQIVDLEERRTARVREQVPVAAMPEFFDRAFTTVMAALTTQGVPPAGPPFGLYHGMPADTVDVEAGFPVAADIEPSDGVAQGVLPAGPAVEVIHVGPYEQLQDTYRTVMDALARDGRQLADVMWEEYLTDPAAEPDPARWQTRLVLPLRED